jgi:hypothetical protein
VDPGVVVLFVLIAIFLGQWLLERTSRTHRLIRAYGEFFHVTPRTAWEDGVSHTGLDPAKGAECCAGRCEPSVFLCTGEKLAESIRMTGTRHNHEDELAILRIDARTLAKKRLIGDCTHQRGIPDLETSLTVTGNLACLDTIRVDELSLADIVTNEEKSNLI